MDLEQSTEKDICTYKIRSFTICINQLCYSVTSHVLSHNPMGTNKWVGSNDGYIISSTKLKKLLQRHFIHHKPHRKLSRLNPRLCSEKPTSTCLSYGTAVACTIGRHGAYVGLWEMHIKFWLGNTMRKDHMEKLDECILISKHY